jgi:aldehyde dehydrogenase (NAD+)
VAASDGRGARTDDAAAGRCDRRPRRRGGARRVAGQRQAAARDAGQLSGLPAYYEYFAGAADKLHGDTIPSDKDNFFIYTVREPVGVVGAITPWNSPILLMSWKLAPALAAGCTFVVKPAEQAPASTLEFARLVQEAGFPPGVFNVITGFGPDCGAPLAEHPGVDKVAFTGSTAVGSSVMAGAASHLAHVSLELGGKSPNIVFADADLEAAANGVVAGIYAATGQTCMAGSRLLVQDSVARVAARAREVRLGDPLRAETEIGPVAFAEHRETVESYIEIGRRDGATLLAGGGRPADPSLGSGLFVEPTLFGDVRNDMRLAREEVSARSRRRSASPTRPRRCGSPTTPRSGSPRESGPATCSARTGSRSGTVWVNSYRAVGPMSPFGGFKASGIARENGLEALREYTETKTVWIELSGATRDPFNLA